MLDERLFNAPYKKATLQEFGEWVHANYWLASRTYAVESDRDIQIPSWRTLGNQYYALVTDRLQFVRQEWFYHPITLRDVIRCYGLPAGYSWTTEFIADARLSHFVVWYPTKGIAFTTGSFYTTDFPKIDLDVKLPFGIIVISGTLEAVADDVYSRNKFGLGNVNASLRNFVPWSENFEPFVMH